MTPTRLQHPEAVVESTTKGWRVDAPLTAAQVRATAPRLDDLPVSWPLACLDADALDHNLATMATACEQAGVLLAPHLKTHMSPPLLQAQLDAGAWGATVATPAQARVALGWGSPGVLLANELVDPADAVDLLRRTAAGSSTLWCYVDSPAGVAVLAEALAAVPAARERFGVLVELGHLQGRTGVRRVDDAVALARAAAEQGLPLRGTSGYEASLTRTTTESDLAAIAGFVTGLRDLAARLVAEDLLPAGVAPVVSVGGSSYLDVVLAVLAQPLEVDGVAHPVQGVVRSGAYLTHDHGMYARTDPWARMTGGPSLRPALDVRAQALSVPEPGLALLGAGKRDVPFDLDLPIPQRVLGPRGERPASGTCFALNDQHLYLRDEAEVAVGELVVLGVSHPCTLFDKWRVLPVLRGDRVVDLVATWF
ncbi:alanine racemase [Auraticoccus sp. F435]|uniref:Alanine racemase n=1 Tax=Auraticoccus cholistanensis TaxID=2656650 RepID=A0A6A9V233_9ACTN|nr:alanine racemase [Auraticoccus cholistanensis]MVA77637.1 alanine racemase [Auraticoccus cholistanensis]